MENHKTSGEVNTLPDFFILSGNPLPDYFSKVYIYLGMEKGPHDIVEAQAKHENKFYTIKLSEKLPLLPGEEGTIWLMGRSASIHDDGSSSYKHTVNLWVDGRLQGEYRIKASKNPQLHDH